MSQSNESADRAPLTAREKLDRLLISIGARYPDETDNIKRMLHLVEMIASSHQVSSHERIGAALRTTRKGIGESLETFAKRLEVSSMTLAQVERLGRGAVTDGTETCLALEKLTGTTIEAIRKMSFEEMVFIFKRALTSTVRSTK